MRFRRGRADAAGGRRWGGGANDPHSRTAIGDTDATLVIEPIDALDVPTNLLPTTTEVARFLERAGHPSVRMLHDAYHAARAGGDPVKEVSAVIDLVAHVQYADCPGPGAPGTDDVDLWRLVDRLAADACDGAIGLEHDPGGGTAASLGFLAGAPPTAPLPERP